MSTALTTRTTGKGRAPSAPAVSRYGVIEDAVGEYDITLAVHTMRKAAKAEKTELSAGHAKLQFAHQARLDLIAGCTTRTGEPWVHHSSDSNSPTGYYFRVQIPAKGVRLTVRAGADPRGHGLAEAVAVRDEILADLAARGEPLTYQPHPPAHVVKAALEAAGWPITPRYFAAMANAGAAFFKDGRHQFGAASARALCILASQPDRFEMARTGISSPKAKSLVAERAAATRPAPVIAPDWGVRTLHGVARKARKNGTSFEAALDAVYNAYGKTR